ncbi:hypothetical protein [Embleya sp. NPDC020886]|uniref:hypothetical protein n=1 Tax=Embleya sp. NPDC020886 TaxID=3363980 RepID=UPI00378BA840
MPIEQWDHDDLVYEHILMYALPDDAWSVELYAGRIPDRRHLITALVHDEDPTRATHVLLSRGELPLPLLRRFLDVVEREESVRDGPWATEPTEERHYGFQTGYVLPHRAWSLELAAIRPTLHTLVIAEVFDEEPRPTRVLFGDGELPLADLRRFLESVDEEEQRRGFARVS